MRPKLGKHAEQPQEEHILQNLTLLLITLSALAVKLPAQAAPTPSPAYTLTIRTDHEMVSAGAEIRVEIVLMNTSQTTILSERAKSKDAAEKAFYIPVVLGPNGLPAPLTKYGREVIKGEGTFIGSSAAMPVKPGETQEHQLVLTNLVDLSQPGKYSIMVKRWDLDSKSDIQSNIIYVTVSK